MRCPFREGVHRESKKVFDEVEGNWKARDVMHWYIKKVLSILDIPPNS